MRVESERPPSVVGLDSTEMSGTDFARRWGVTLRALRFYEMRGLLSPRRQKRMRVYSQVDGHRVRLILHAKKLGFTLAEIGQMIDVKAGAPSSQGLLLTPEKCLQQINHLERHLKTTMDALADLRRIHLALCLKAGNVSEGEG